MRGEAFGAPRDDQEHGARDGQRLSEGLARRGKPTQSQELVGGDPERRGADRDRRADADACHQDGGEEEHVVGGDGHGREQERTGGGGAHRRGARRAAPVRGP